MEQDYQKTYEERNTDRVNLAEVKARKYYEEKGYYVTRFGFDEKNENVPKEYFKLIPAKIRNMPEYVIVGKECWLLEAKGCRDILRVKLEDMTGYEFWNGVCKMAIFIYSFKYNHCYIVSYQRLKEFVLSGDSTVTKEKYHDNNKEHYAMPVGELALIGHYEEYN